MAGNAGWRRRDSGPVVRPYALTGGRTEPGDGEVLDLLAVVVAGHAPATGRDTGQLTPEHRRILALCQQPVTVADIAADLDLPVGVVRVLLADLIRQDAVVVVRKRSSGQEADTTMLQEILNGLRAL